MRKATSVLLACLPVILAIIGGCNGVKEDCVGFDPKNIEVKDVNGSWKIVEGGHWIMDFGSNEEEARMACDIIKHYGITSHCFVGRPDASMTYYLVNGKPPTGSYPGEDCITFNPDNIVVVEVNGSWRIVEGSQQLIDFGDKSGEATLAATFIKKYGFTHICYVGRPNPSMTYFRK